MGPKEMLQMCVSALKPRLHNFKTWHDYVIRDLLEDENKWPTEQHDLQVLRKCCELIPNAETTKRESQLELMLEHMREHQEALAPTDIQQNKTGNEQNLVHRCVIALKTRVHDFKKWHDFLQHNFQKNTGQTASQRELRILNECASLLCSQREEKLREMLVHMRTHEQDLQHVNFDSVTETSQPDSITTCVKALTPRKHNFRRWHDYLAYNCLREGSDHLTTEENNILDECASLVLQTENGQQRNDRLKLLLNHMLEHADELTARSDVSTSDMSMAELTNACCTALRRRSKEDHK